MKHIATIKSFILGMREFRSMFTTRQPDRLDHPYECGREWMHKVTFRCYEQ